MQPGGNVPLAQPTPKVPPEIYRLEAFAATSPAWPSKGVVFVKFDLAQGTNGYVAVEVDARAPAQVPGRPRARRPGPRPGSSSTPTWKWERQRAVARLTPGAVAVLAVPTAAARRLSPLALTPSAYASSAKPAPKPGATSSPGA